MLERPGAVQRGEVLRRLRAIRQASQLSLRATALLGVAEKHVTATGPMNTTAVNRI